MGLTIHFKGTINDIFLIEKLKEEIEDISISMNWKYNLRGPKNSNFSGISINIHPDCEWLSLVFDNNGKIVPPMELHFGEKGISDYQFIKTQFAGVEIHLAVVNLLKYVQKKYIKNLEVIDESKYWDTGDKTHVLKYLKTVNKGINNIRYLSY
jgi:hypothetical protein